MARVVPRALRIPPAGRGEILAILDEAISDLRAACRCHARSRSPWWPTPRRALSLEPLAEMPSIRRADRSGLSRGHAHRPRRARRASPGRASAADRGGIGHSAGRGVALRRLAETRIRAEQAIDIRYGAMARRLMNDATRGAAASQSGRRAAGARSDSSRRCAPRRSPARGRAGAQRVGPGAARVLRGTCASCRDQWMIRRSLYLGYSDRSARSCCSSSKSQSALEAIRRLDGPPPEALVTLQARLQGGAERLAAHPAAVRSPCYA